MNSLKLITIILTIYLILAISIVANAKKKDPCTKDSPEVVLLELSKKLRREAARSYLSLDWNGTSVSHERYDELIKTNKDHYDEDPNLRLVNP